MAPIPGDSSKRQFGTSMPQGGYPPHHSIASSASARSLSGTVSLRRSLDQLIRDQQDVTIDRQSHRSGRLHVDDQLELGWSFDGQLRGLCPFEYLVHI